MTDQCPHCGNNPVSHRLTWASASVSVLALPIHSRTGRWLDRLGGYIAKYAFMTVVYIFRMCGLARTSTDPAGAMSDRGKVLWEEALRRGYKFNGYTVLGKNTDAYRAQLKGRTLYFSAILRPVTTESGADWWLDDKALLKDKLKHAGIPTPRGGSFSRFEPLRTCFEMLEKPVIVKPRIGSRGRHATTHITTEEELYDAFLCAKQLCHWVVLEEHLVGSVYRGTLIDGKLVGVLRGDPPRIVGDGERTIVELVAIKNSLRHSKVAPVELTDTHERFLLRTGRNFDTVPPLGQVVDLLEKIGVSYGGYSAEEIDITHLETRRVLEAAGRAIADPIIGFDFIIADITRNPHEQKWGIIECNSAPFINLHHDPVGGTPINVAAHVWDYTEKYLDRF
ncbi:hypothetical protein HY970_03305 [Candidatus Kaiserbacteria bacterium]|nr:hypothetical protein [Candidatus Kaiserbacteria bacterium]